MLGHVSDIIIEIYALESALLRTSKLIAGRGPDSCATQIDITRAYAGDAADRMTHSVNQVAVELFDRPLTRPKLNMIAVKKRIADAVIKAGRYHL